MFGIPFIAFTVGVFLAFTFCQFCVVIRFFHPRLNGLVVECWLLVREVPGSISSQGPRHTKDVIQMVPVANLINTEHSKGKYWLFLKN